MNSAVPERLLIIGYGSPIRGDDSAGLHVARRAAEAGLESIETVQLVPELAVPIAAATGVIFVDCDATLPPGELALRTVTPAALSGHALHNPATPESLLSLALELYGSAPAASMLGIGPATMELGDALSSEAEGAVERALSIVKERSRRG